MRYTFRFCICSDLFGPRTGACPGTRTGPRTGACSNTRACSGTRTGAYACSRTGSFAGACAGRNTRTNFQFGSGSVFKSATSHTGGYDTGAKLECTPRYCSGNRLIDSGLQRRELQHG